jgi:molecular chaperone DnaK (HSP70)
MSEFDAGHTLGVDVGSRTTVAAARTPDGRVRILPVPPSADPRQTLAAVGAAWGRAVGKARPEVILTYPHGCDSQRRAERAEVAKAAGFPAVRVLSEPLAATGYFTHVLGRPMGPGSVLIVHDIGARTFDVGIVVRRAVGFEVVAADHRDFGGDDLDEAIVRHVGAPSRSALLSDRVRAMKERLSTAEKATFTMDDIEGSYSRRAVEQLAMPMFTESVEVTARLAQKLTPTEDPFVGVLLVGGTSRMPVLATLIQRATGRPPVTVERPETVLAHGAAVVAAPAAVARARRWWQFRR